MNLGNYSYTGRNINVLFENDASYVIGKFCSIASDLTICLGGNHRHDWLTTYPFGHTQHNVFTTYNGLVTLTQKEMLLLGMMFGLATMLRLCLGLRLAMVPY